MTEPHRLRLFFDYVDPASYFLHRQILELEEERSGRLILWHPFEICPPPSPLLSPDDAAWRQQWEQLQAGAAAEGFDVVEPWIIPWSRKAHELALHARERSCFQEIHDAIFRAYFGEGRDIGRVDVLVTIAGEVGLDAMEARAVLGVDRFSDEVEDLRKEGLEAGVRRPPALEGLGGTLQGAPDEPTLRALLDPIRRTDEN